MSNIIIKIPTTTRNHHICRAWNILEVYLRGNRNNLQGEAEMQLIGGESNFAKWRRLKIRGVGVTKTEAARGRETCYGCGGDV